MDILVPHGEEELIEVSSAPVDPVQQRHVNILVMPGFDLVQDIMTEASASDEAVLFSQDTKLLRYRVNEWEDRSNGKAVLFLHAATGRQRFSDGTRAILGHAKITMEGGSGQPLTHLMRSLFLVCLRCSLLRCNKQRTAKNWLTRPRTSCLEEVRLPLRSMEKRA